MVAENGPQKEQSECVLITRVFDAPRHLIPSDLGRK